MSHFDRWARANSIVMDIYFDKLLMLQFPPIVRRRKLNIYRPSPDGLVFRNSTGAKSILSYTFGSIYCVVTSCRFSFFKTLLMGNSCKILCYRKHSKNGKFLRKNARYCYQSSNVRIARAETQLLVYNVSEQVYLWMFMGLRITIQAPVSICTLSVYPLSRWYTRFTLQTLSMFNGSLAKRVMCSFGSERYQSSETARTFSYQQFLSIKKSFFVYVYYYP